MDEVWFDGANGEDMVKDKYMILSGALVDFQKVQPEATIAIMEPVVDG